MNPTAVRIDPRNWLEEHGDVLYGHALRALSNPEEAEDFVQDTLLQGIRQLEGFQGRCSLRTWLLAILKNRIVDHYRRCSRRPQQVPEEDCPVELVGQGGGPDQVVVEAEVRAHLQDCIEELPEPLQQMFVLSEVDGYRHGELGERFQVTQGHVRVRLHRARLKVRDCLVRKGVGL